MPKQKDQRLNNLQIVQVKISELKPAKYNPRKWDAVKIKQLAESIEEFGIVDPLVVNSAKKRMNIVIGGHFRLKVAKDLGFKEMPVVYVNIPDEQKERELNLRLNKNLGDWDYDLLADFDEGILSDVGFESQELDKIFDLKTSEDDFDAEKEYEKIIKAKAKEDDLYQLGGHKLLCGDSTKIESFEKLMDSEKAQLIFTDPPYNVGYKYSVRYDGGKRTATGKELFNDSKSNKEFEEFLFKVFENAHKFTKDSAGFYCWYSTSQEMNVRSAFERAGWHYSQTIIWVKEQFIFSKGVDYNRIYEPCYFGWKEGKKHFVIHQYPHGTNLLTIGFEDFQELLDVMFENRGKISDREHPTQKPVRLAERAIKKHSEQKGIVLDCFGGSGSTLIACEQMKRRCFSIELDPKFVDVIVNRWERLTDKKAKKVNLYG